MVRFLVLFFVLLSWNFRVHAKGSVSEFQKDRLCTGSKKKARIKSIASSCHRYYYLATDICNVGGYEPMTNESESFQKNYCGYHIKVMALRTQNGMPITEKTMTGDFLNMIRAKSGSVNGANKQLSPLALAMAERESYQAKSCINEAQNCMTFCGEMSKPLAQRCQAFAQKATKQGKVATSFRQLSANTNFVASQTKDTGWVTDPKTGGKFQVEWVKQNQPIKNGYITAPDGYRIKIVDGRIDGPISREHAAWLATLSANDRKFLNDVARGGGSQQEQLPWKPLSRQQYEKNRDEYSNPKLDNVFGRKGAVYEKREDVVEDILKTSGNPDIFSEQGRNDY